MRIVQLGLLLGIVWTHALKAAEVWTGAVSQEAIHAESGAPQWQHQRTRLDLSLNTSDAEFASVFWSFAAEGFAQYDKSLAMADRSEFRIENLNVLLFRDSMKLKIGWQTLQWGETLGPSLVDAINPRDLRDPTGWVKADKKLAVPMLLLGVSQGSFTADIWSSPWSGPSLLPSTLQTLPLVQPDRSFRHDFGCRIGQRLAGWDIKLYALEGEARLPTLSLDLQSTQPLIVAKFPRQRSFGLTLTQAWDDWVLRAEMLQSRSHEVPADNQLAYAEQQAVLGMDGSIGEHFLWGTEWRGSRQQSLLSADRAVSWWIGQGRWNLWHDRLRPAFYVAQRLDHSERYQRHEIASSILNSHEISVTWESFTGGPEAVFKRLGAQDRLGLAWRWEF